MKSKVIISLILAVLMLVTLATPALAAKPLTVELRGWVAGEPTGPVVGKVSVQVTHDNSLRTTVVLKEGTPGVTYQVMSNLNLGLDSDTFTVGKSGRGRLAGRSNTTYGGSYEVFIGVRLASGGGYLYGTEYFQISFNP